ncbi:phosphoethanolamine transferase [Stenotrophobium rhamnosiphilum]|nr:phosphoethanolamine--lipid A transferase [Stenotrophobium rhamnosiphilum]
MNSSVSSEVVVVAPAQTSASSLSFLPTLGANQLLLLTVLYLVTTQNLSLFEAIVHSLPRPFGAQEWRILASTVYALATILVLAMAGLCLPRVQKPALAIFVLISAVCSYFMESFGTVIDRAMIANAFNTDVHEASDLLSLAFFMHVLTQGVLPAWIIARLPLRFESFGVELRRRLALVGIMLCGLLIILFSQFSTLSFWGRENRSVRLYVNPTAPMYAMKEAVVDLLPKGPPPTLLSVAPDAVRVSNPTAKPLLIVLVVGETARAANFGLNGYARNTTPRLSTTPGLINYPNFESCGTATLQSVPCMFSRLGQQEFSRKKASAEENLLDIVARTGVPTIWRDNNAGCMGVCVRTGSVSFESESDPKLCADGECHDDILLKDFDAVMPKTAGSAHFLVLHQKGSHGPAYFKRYPESARHFTPDCRNASVQRCSREEVVNAYDNTIVYTDTMLADLIEQLRAHQNSVDSVMLYVSDHGESLGENGIYLHGLPRSLAPAEQTHVPMMAWFSAHAPAALKIDVSCVKALRTQPGSHDNLFDSILDLLSIRTAAYKPTQDLFASCKKQ